MIMGFNGEKSMEPKNKREWPIITHKTLVTNSSFHVK